jgi:hypothetical protein
MANNDKTLVAIISSRLALLGAALPNNDAPQASVKHSNIVSPSLDVNDVEEVNECFVAPKSATSNVTQDLNQEAVNNPTNDVMSGHPALTS